MENIYIATANRPDIELLSTFYHELFHCVIYRIGIYNAELSRDLEEVIVDSFATIAAEIQADGSIIKLFEEKPKKPVKKKK